MYTPAKRVTKGKKNKTAWKRRMCPVGIYPVIIRTQSSDSDLDGKQTFSRGQQKISVPPPPPSKKKISKRWCCYCRKYRWRWSAWGPTVTPSHSCRPSSRGDFFFLFVIHFLITAAGFFVIWHRCSCTFKLKYISARPCNQFFRSNKRYFLVASTYQTCCKGSALYQYLLTFIAAVTMND